MIRQSLAVFAVVAASACAHGGTEPAGAVRGQDLFAADTRSEYTLYGFPSRWVIGDGSLTAAGPAFHEVMIRNDVEFADGWVETSTRRADDGGLVLRFVDPNNYYLLGFRDDAAPEPRGRRNLQIYRKWNGDYIEATVSDIEWPRGTEHTVRFAAAGATFTAYVDGREVARWTDPDAMRSPGGFGVRHYGAEEFWTTRFELLRWRETAR